MKEQILDAFSSMVDKPVKALLKVRYISKLASVFFLYILTIYLFYIIPKQNKSSIFAQLNK